MKKHSKREQFKKYIDLYQQYEKKYGKIALLYQLGMFYELMGVDNDKEKLGNVGEICKDTGLRLSRADKKIVQNSRDNPLQAGFPVHAKDYIKALTDANYTVIVYDQFEKGGKHGRELTRILSPGTYIEGENLADTDTINLAVIYGKEFNVDGDSHLSIALIILDMTTGKTVCYSMGDKRELVIKNVEKILKTDYPREVVMYDVDLKAELDLENILIHVKKMDKIVMRPSYQDECLAKVFPNHGQLSPTEYINLEKYPDICCAFVSLLNFAFERDEHILTKISKPTIREIGDYIHLTSSTISQLNILQGEDKHKSLFDICNMCSTPGGKRLLKTRLLNPITCPKKIATRYDQIENLDYEQFEHLLEGICDLDRYLRKLFLGKIAPAEFYTLDSSFESIEKILKYLPCKENINSASIKQFQKCVKFYREYLDVEQLQKFNLDNMTQPIFKQGLYVDVDEFYKKLVESKDGLQNLAMELSEKIGVPDSVKVSSTVSEGYYLMTSKKRYQDFLAKDGFIVKTQSTTVKMWNEDISRYSRFMVDSTENIQKINQEKFLDLMGKISSTYSVALKNISTYISHVDLIKSCKKCATLYGYIRPEISARSLNDSYVNIKGLRHPIYERICQDVDYVTNDISLGNILLYGVNGSGKSLLLKSVACTIIMAQAGFFVPAKKFVYYPFQTIITKLAMRDNFYKQQSHFTSEMLDLRHMLNNANPNTLVLADELCSGTETVSAVGIVAASIKYLVEQRCNFFFTTHLHQLMKIPELTNLNINIFHMAIKVINNKIVYERKLLPGSGSDTYGIEIARHLNVGNSEFIRFATSVRRQIKGESSEIVSKKQSKYNLDVYMDSCVECGSRENLHTHHIQHQADADKNGMINGLHKNRKANLKVLCEECHQHEHGEDHKVQDKDLYEDHPYGDDIDDVSDIDDNIDF